jgi:hypothetical protein
MKHITTTVTFSYRVNATDYDTVHSDDAIGMAIDAFLEPFEGDTFTIDAYSMVDVADPVPDDQEA